MMGIAMITQDSKLQSYYPPEYVEEQDRSKINGQMIQEKVSEESDNVRVLDFLSYDENEKSERDRDDLCYQTDP